MNADAAAGQAHLPHLETLDQSGNSLLESLSIETTAYLDSAQGREGGLAPAHSLTFMLVMFV